jgi:serine/threonine-protein kinase RsbW
MSAPLELRIRNRAEDLSSAMEAISRWLGSEGAFAGAEYLALLAVEELVTNCIKYAYDDTLEHWICIGIRLSAVEMVVTIEDDGHPFDPRSLPEPDTSLPLEDRPIGGLGIHLLRNLFDALDYSRVEGQNRVVLRKRASTESST